MSSLLEKIKSANSTSSGIDKSEFVDEILDLYEEKNSNGMKNLFEAYETFLLKFSEEPECETIFRAQRNMDHLTKIADLVCLGRNYFEAEESVKKGLGLSFPGPVRKFYHDSTGYKMIELPGFETSYNGALYFRNKTISVARLGQDFAVRSYVFLRRYALPAKDAIVSYLQQKAAPLQSMEITNPDYNKLSPLEREIALLSSAVKKELVSGKNLGFVKSLLPVEIPDEVHETVSGGSSSSSSPGFQESSKGLQESSKGLQEKLHILNAALPLDFIEDNRQAGNIKGLGWFNAALVHPFWKTQDGLGMLWTLQLPKEVCLQGKTKFNFVDLSAEEIDEAKTVLNAVYAALPSEDHFRQVFDATSIRLEEIAYSLIKSLQKESEAQKKGLDEMLAGQPFNYTVPGDKGNN